MSPDPEINFFSALFMWPDSVHDVALVIAPEDFPNDEQRHTYRSMLELSQAGLPITTSRVLDKLTQHNISGERACEIIERLTDGCPIEGEIRDYAKLMLKHANRRRVSAVLNAAIGRAQAHEDTQKIVSDLQESLSAFQA